MLLFANDPGTTNYGYAIVVGKKRGANSVVPTVLENGLVPCTIKNLKDHKERRKQRDEYKEWAARKIEQYDVRAIIGERYMTRGINGPTVECVNMMLGVLQSFGLPDVYIPAATWKNGLTRAGIDLKQEYKFCRTTPHQLDASLIGYYGLCRGFGIKDFGDLTQKQFDKFMQQVEDTSTEDLFNRKLKKG